MSCWARASSRSRSTSSAWTWCWSRRSSSVSRRTAPCRSISCSRTGVSGVHAVQVGRQLPVGSLSGELQGLLFGGEGLGLPAPLPLDRRHLQRFLASQHVPVTGELLLLDAALGSQLGQPDLLLRPDVRLIALELDVVADFGLQLLPEGRVDDEDLGDLGDLDVDPPGTPLLVAVADGRLHRRLDDAAERGLALLDALDHRHVRDGVAQLTEADMGEERGDLPDAVPTAEVEESGGGARVRDPVDDRALEPERDAVLRLLRELERGLLLRARDRGRRWCPGEGSPGRPNPGSRALPRAPPTGTGSDPRARSASA